MKARDPPALFFLIEFDSIFAAQLQKFGDGSSRTIAKPFKRNNAKLLGRSCRAPPECCFRFNVGATVEVDLIAQDLRLERRTKYPIVKRAIPNGVFFIRKSLRLPKSLKRTLRVRVMKPPKARQEPRSPRSPDRLFGSNVNSTCRSVQQRWTICMPADSCARYAF